MKKTIALLLTLVMLSCIVAGCSGNQNNNAPQDNDPANTAAPAQTDEPQVVYEKTYKSTFSTSITSMNPYCTEFTSDYNFISNIAEGLVERTHHAHAQRVRRPYGKAICRAAVLHGHAVAAKRPVCIGAFAFVKKIKLRLIQVSTHIAKHRLISFLYFTAWRGVCVGRFFAFTMHPL